VDQRMKKAARTSFMQELSEFLRRYTSWFLVVGLALLLLQDIFGTHGVLAMRRTQEQAAKIRQEIERLDQENRRLQGCVAGLKSDPAAVERIAREDMGLARPGEYVFKIPPKSGEAPSTPCPLAPQQNPR
jgi:cell division protein FtsB